MRRLARSSSGFVALVFGFAVLAPSARADDVSVRLDAGTAFSVRDNTGAIERLRVDEATGNISRNGMLFVHTTSGVGPSLFVGNNAGLLGSGQPGNTAFGNGAMDQGGGYNNTAVGFAALANRSFGYANTGVGFAALANGGGSLNAAVGYHALSLGGGDSNAALGAMSMMFTTTGSYNAAVGLNSLYFNTTGERNVALGSGALSDNTTGSENTAIGQLALSRGSTGSSNVAIGNLAGANQTTGNDNIYLANRGVASENGQIKIGTVGTHTQAQIAGIHGATSSGGIAVLVNASGTLGTTTSSARFKRDVEDMGDASDLLMRLRPVRFHYLEEAVGAEESRIEQYGLIAEEVAEVAPELVAPGADGKPYSVKYHELPALLLNEVQAQRRVNDEHKQLIATLNARIEQLEKAAAAR